MSSIPSNLSRAPTLLFSQIALGNLTRTNLALFTAQSQLSSGRLVTRYSDDAVSAASIAVLNDRLGRTEQRQRNLDNADSSLNLIDSALGQTSDLVGEARTIASAQLNTGTSAAERASQSQIVSSLITNLFGIANRRSVSGYLFGGTVTDTAPVREDFGGYRYVGQGAGLVTDIGLGQTTVVTLGADAALGQASARVQGTVDLAPGLTGATKLADLAGARGLGVTLGRIELTVDTGAGPGPRVAVDLEGADTAQDVATRITTALRSYEAESGTTVLGPGGVSFFGRGFRLDVAPGSGGGPNPQIRFFDVGTGVTAQDLGLASTPATVFSSTATDGLGVGPRLTFQTPVSALAGLTGGGLGSIRVNNNGQSRVVDISQAQTLQDIKNAIEGTNLGVRVEINADATGINVVNEVAAGRTQAMSIEEVSGSTPPMTATRLGIRSLSGATRLAGFNDGRGVRIVDGSLNPTTSLPDPTRDVDFTVQLGDPAGTTISVDLRPQDMTTVQSVIDRINAQAAAQGVAASDFRAGLSDGANGLVLTQNAAFTGTISVAALNGSLAAADLGLASGSYDAASASLRAQDTARVRVDNLFTHLIDLRDALASNDTPGIALAGQRLEGSVDRIAQTRAVVGGYSQRVRDAQHREEDTTVLDSGTRSSLQDVDFTEAAVRLSALQTQLSAGLRSFGMASSQTLLDFLR
jgi:flagellar hook-associated protein 3 FlgL